jgi:hypothetical protein
MHAQFTSPRENGDILVFCPSFSTDSLGLCKITSRYLSEMIKERKERTVLGDIIMKLEFAKCQPK